MPANLAFPLAFGGGSSSGGSGNLPGLYTPVGWNANIKAKLAAASSSRAIIATVGDSLTVGQFCSNLDTKSWPSLLKIALQAAYGDGGSGYKTSGHSVAGIANPTYTGAGLGGLVTVTGTWNMSVADGPGASCIRGESLNAASTWSVRGTSIEVFYLGANNSGFGTFTVTIDGSLVDTVNSNNATSAVLQKTYAVSAGAHTVVITATTAAGSGVSNALICGVSGRNATGVIVDNYGHGNWPSTAMANTTGNTWDVVSNGSGALQGTFGPAGKWSGGSLRPADLVIWAFGANDCRSVASGYGVTPTQYAINMRNYLDDVRAANPNVDILLILQHIGQNLEDAALKYYTQYGDRMRTMAETYSAGMINLWALGRDSYLYGTQTGYWGDQAAPGAAGTSGVHLSDVGNATVANYVQAAITG